MANILTFPTPIDQQSIDIPQKPKKRHHYAIAGIMVDLRQILDRASAPLTSALRAVATMRAPSLDETIHAHAVCMAIESLQQAQMQLQCAANHANDTDTTQNALALAIMACLLAGKVSEKLVGGNHHG